MRIPALLTVAAAGLTAAATLATPAAAAPGSTARFIITVDDAYDSRAVAAEHRRNGADIDFVYTAALNGFAGAMSDAELGALQRDRRVTRIERDGIAAASETLQTNATWGLDRVDARSGLDGIYRYTATGTGVSAYIIDTGVRLTHSEFGARAVSGYDAVDGGSADDCNGHGTHVAGTVGGATYGVAKAARLVAVRVLDCAGSGTWSGVIAGLDWVTANHVKPAVANMSLGGGANTSVDDAVKRTIGSGVTVVVAAGNGNAGGKEQDACNYSPARVPAAVTIGATTSSDAKTSWSNYGSCVDFFAPGASITSAWHTGDGATNTISGTSMAAPHVAGVAALYLEGQSGSTTQQVRDAMYDATTKGIVTSSKTANNHLLYSRITATAVVRNGTVGGTVTTTEGDVTSAVANATVSANGSKVLTAADGTYSLSLPPGDHVVSVTADGFEGATAIVTITSDTTTTGNFSLTRSSESAAASIVLSVKVGTKAKGTTPVTSSWTDDTTYSGTYTVFVNGNVHKEAVTGTSETTRWKGSGTLVYQVCRSSTQTCSDSVSVTV